MVYSCVLGNVTRDMSDEMILSRLIDQVGNKHIVSHWKVRRKCQQYHQCTTAMNKYTLVLHFITTKSPTTTTWSLFFKYRLCLNNRALHFLFSIFSTSTRRYNLTQISYIVSYSCNQAVSSWGMKKFLCANYPTLLPALHLTIQDFYF